VRPLLLWFTFMAAASLAALAMAPADAGAELVRRARAAAGAGPARDALEHEELRRPLLERAVAPALGRLGRFLLELTPLRIRERLQAVVRAAGADVDSGTLLAHKALLALLAGAAAAAALRGRPLLPAVAAAAAVAAWRWPDLRLQRAAAARRRVIARALPDVLDLLCVSVEAGLGFDGAMQKVAEKFPGPVAAEFGAYLRDVRLGRGREESLRAMAARCGVDELRTAVAVVIQTERLGAPLGRVLRVQSDDLRVRRRQAAQERALQIPVKLIFPLVLFIFPAVFVVLLGPAALQVMRGLARP
jgi:tight adherence protein C